MAGAARLPLLLLLLAAVALPALLVQGFIPVSTYQRQHGGDASLEGDAWRRSSSAGSAGGLHPQHHYPKSFHHTFIRRPGKSLLEGSAGEAQEIDPRWVRWYHGKHGPGHAEGHHGDVGLAGEHHRHRGEHAGFREHHRRDGMPARAMAEGEWKDGESVPSRLGHRRHAGFRHRAAHGSDELAERQFGAARFRHFRDTGRVRDVRPSEPKGSAGAWESFKSQLAYGASSVAAKIQSAGNQLRSWVSPSRPRVAPTVSYPSDKGASEIFGPAEPGWEVAPVSTSCGLDRKLRHLLLSVLEDENLSMTSEASCTESLEFQTRRLMHNLKHQLKSFCSKDVEVGCQQTFCNFVNGHSRLAAVMLLSKFEFDPVSSFNASCRPQEMDDIYRNIHHLSRRVHASVDSLPLEISGESQADGEGKPVCEACLEQSSHQLKKMFKEHLVQTCQLAACPKLKDACDFVKDHWHLGRTLLMLKVKPWEKAAQSCASSCTAPLPVSISTGKAAGLQFRGSEFSDAMEWSRLFDKFQTVGSLHPHFLIVEFVRRNPASPREMLDTMHQIFAANDVKGEEDKQADEVSLENKQVNGDVVVHEQTEEQDVVVAGEHEQPEAGEQAYVGTPEPLLKESGLPAEELLKEQFFRALNHVFGEVVRSSGLPEDPVGLSGSKGLAAVSSADASAETDARKADM